MRGASLGAREKCGNDVAAQTCGRLDAALINAMAFLKLRGSLTAPNHLRLLACIAASLRGFRTGRKSRWEFFECVTGFFLRRGSTSTDNARTILIHATVSAIGFA